MKIVQYRLKGDASAAPKMGALVDGGNAILDLQAAIQGAPGAPTLPANTSCDWWDLGGQIWPWVQRIAREAAASGSKVPLVQTQLFAPVPRPGKLICIGLNYRDHALESNMKIPTSPVTFSKFQTSIVGPGATVVIPTTCTQPDYEAELGVVIGRRARNVSRTSVNDYIFGYCCINDVSARDYQFGDGQWQRGKSCDTFAPMGPAVVTADEVPNPGKLPIRLRLNGELMQNSNTEQLIFGIPELIEFLSSCITLEPGDVIATGTPAGVGFARKPPVYLKAGDQMQVEIDGVGVLENTVAASA